MESLFTIENLMNFVTLSGLEVVLGIDNLIFIAIVVEHLKGEERNKARIIGISLAFLMRIGLLATASHLMTFTEPLFEFYQKEFSGKSLLLILGGLFLIVKTLLEMKDMFAKLELADPLTKEKPYKKKSFKAVVAQIVFVDFIFSFDSIIVAVGLSNNMAIIVAAIAVALIAMLLTMNLISDFIHKNPNVKILAIGFIMLIGVFLVLNGFDIYVNKAYLYFAMFFSLSVELIGIKYRNKRLKYEQHKEVAHE